MLIFLKCNRECMNVEHKKGGKIHLFIEVTSDCFLRINAAKL